MVAGAAVAAYCVKRASARLVIIPLRHVAIFDFGIGVMQAIFQLDWFLFVFSKRWTKQNVHPDWCPSKFPSPTFSIREAIADEDPCPQWYEAPVT
jgi:hypothetical protein